MTILTAAITLFLVLDPLGNIPVFLSVLRSVDANRRRRIILRELVIALAVLVLFLLFGRYILRAMNISAPALSVGGGVVLFIISLRMIFPELRSGATAGGGPESTEEPLIVPLAVPLVAGPSAMATLILFSTQYPERIGAWFIALLAAWTVSVAVLLAGEFLRRVLGTRGLAAMERLMGMILVTVAVQMVLTGLDMRTMTAALY